MVSTCAQGVTLSVAEPPLEMPDLEGCPLRWLTLAPEWDCWELDGVSLLVGGINNGGGKKSDDLEGF